MQLENIIQAHDGHHLDNQLKPAADARSLPSWDQPVKILSGGRDPLHLAKLLKSGENVLLLNEQTNDLDIETLRALEDPY